MRGGQLIVLIAATVLSSEHIASAQESSPRETDLVVSVSALAAVQPVDDAYVGQPYLDKGLAGMGPGRLRWPHAAAPRACGRGRILRRVD